MERDAERDTEDKWRETQREREIDTRTTFESLKPRATSQMQDIDERMGTMSLK